MAMGALVLAFIAVGLLIELSGKLYAVLFRMDFNWIISVAIRRA